MDPRGCQMCLFHREDVGWWRSWLQQSYQAVKEKVSRPGSLPPPGPRTASLQLGAAPPGLCGCRVLGEENDSLPTFSPFRGYRKTDADLGPWDTSHSEIKTFKGCSDPLVGIHRKEIYNFLEEKRCHVGLKDKGF